MRYKFSEITVNFDSKRVPLSAKQRKLRSGKYPYYGAQGIIDYIDDYIFDGKYLLIAEDGENLKSKKQKIAQLANGQYWVNNHAHIVRTNEKCLLDYLYYAFNNTDISGYITGSAQPKLSQANLNAIEFEIPSLDYQKRVVAILSAFDDKIELNQRINENLERQVMTSFQQKFVKNKNDKRRICQAGEYFDISIGKTPPRKEPQWFSVSPDDCIWVSISDMGSCGLYICDSSEYLTYDAVEKFNVKIVPSNTVLLSFKLTVGRVAITDGTMTTNEAIAHFKTERPEINEYLYCYLKDFNYQTMGSTSSIATAVNSRIIKGMPFIIPTDEEIDTFHEFAGLLFAMIKNNQQENVRLTTLRDALLPKLMSGEIDLRSVNI